MLKITDLKMRDMKAVLNDVTKDSSYKWYCKKSGCSIIVGNDYFSKYEYYVIYPESDGYIGINLNYMNLNICGIIIDDTYSFADYNEWCIQAFEDLVKKCYHHFKYCV